MMADVTDQQAATTISPDDLYRTATGVIFGRIRRTHNWSLRDFGERVGVSHTSLYAVERGEAAPTIDTLARVAAVEGLDLPAILALVIDELINLGDVDTVDANAGSLSNLITAAASLTGSQRAELLGFIEYLRHRDRGLTSRP